MPPVLTAHAVSVTLGSTAVLRDVNLAVSPGDSIAVIGGSNSGKSTLLRVLAGLVRPARGEVLFKGNPVRSWDPLGVPWPHGIGYVSQLLGLRSNMSVLDNVMLPLRYHGHLPELRIRERATTLLMRLGVIESNVRPAALAPGEAELVALARALAHEPSVLLFDNPSAVLDVDSADRVTDLLRELRGLGLAVVSASSSEAVAAVIADSVRRLRDGRMEEQ
ncbi:MAG: ATP-binding cassette domain-containing protein [Candidatus Eisenbacteria bacterium]|nr:ATP-binding cassette domain-containing protein [Candidatus Eisenbacteria bacterium]